MTPMLSMKGNVDDRTKRPDPAATRPPSRGQPSHATAATRQSRRNVTTPLILILILTLSVCLHQLNRALDLRRLLERLVAHGLDLLHGALDDLVLGEQLEHA